MAVDGVNVHKTHNGPKRVDGVKGSTDVVTKQLSVFDLIPPRVYIKFLVYLPLKPGVNFHDAFSYLQTGLSAMLSRFRFMDGRIFPRPEHEEDWKPGQLVVRYSTTATSNQQTPRQLQFKDLSSSLPSYDELADAGFEFSAFEDDVVLAAPFMPDLAEGVDVFLAQANFVEGGCLLATGIHHSASDATGMVTFMRAWAEYCTHATNGGKEEPCKWLAPESFDRTILERLWSERPARPVKQIDRGTWQFLGFQPPETHTEEEDAAEQPPPSSPISAKPQRTMESSIFYMSPAAFKQLKKEVMVDDDTGLTANDALLALFWRAIMAARYRAARANKTLMDDDGEISYLESPVDGRPLFDPQLPSSYAGNLVVVNKVGMSVPELASPSTNIRDVALRIREQVGKTADPQLAHDAFTLMREVPDYTKLKHAFTRLDGFDVMITSLLLMPLYEIDFVNNALFGNDGRIDAARPLMDAFNANFRLCMILPIKEHGGIELLVSLFSDEMEELLKDKEFGRFALFACH